jgi:hypothetical protein
MQIGCSNAGMIKPALHVGEVIGDRERAAPSDFNAAHREPLLSSAGDELSLKPKLKDRLIDHRGGIGR